MAQQKANLPRFLCIGAQKAGTSWLDRRLREHPEIWLPPFKELHFFDHKFVEENRNWTHGHLRKAALREIKRFVHNKQYFDLNYIHYLTQISGSGGLEAFTEDWYRTVFTRPAAMERVTGEITPAYSILPEAGVQYVREILGYVKSIYLVRDPVDRAKSQVKMIMRRRELDPKKMKNWETVLKNPEIGARGEYGATLNLWTSIMGEENLLVLPFGRLRDDPLSVMRRVEEFIGVSHYEGYVNPEQKVHAGAEADVPDSVVKALEERFAHQRQGIKDWLGPEFLSEC